ncbi:class I SAM-dependent methyltransferase, partial [bacterium]
FLLSFVMARGAVPYHGDGRFLDVGCGGGSYLYRLRQWGWKVYGVEPNESGVQQARALGLDVQHGELTDVHFPESFFDVIRLNNVLEHLADPKEAFREIKRILKPHGIVYITVPNTRSLNFWLFGENWYGLDSPRHVISYCPKALTLLCAATDLEIVKIDFRSGAFNFVRSVKYYLEENGDNWPEWMRHINWPGNKIIRRTLKPFFYFIDTFRLGDVMEATLKKAP